MFQSVLIANRGEIACRVIRTAKRMGLRTIAVYSEADRHALHVQMADEAYLLGPAPVGESYLDADKVLAVARESGAECVHPGYGFLSENAGFAEGCAKAGITFVGPPVAAISSMGEKDRARQIMAEAGVPVVPGYDGANQDAAFLKQKAYEIGYPVMIKAVSGGGGKGMRKVDVHADFDEALVACQREAKSAFGDDRVLIEKFVSQPRHIEVQVFGDTHGNVVHLFERDCSLQRRHQKVIEEAPAPKMPDEVREAVTAAAVKAAKSVDYVGAGTVEFIADSSGGLSRGGFYFMEMNTRLQVEHPVTEMITGIDLVEWQLRAAAGEVLPLQQDDITMDGHAFEARIYAEDPARGFLPQIGRLEDVCWPDGNGGRLRIETGVGDGDTISPFYDPMIAKLVVHGADREAALEALKTALNSTHILGLAHNIAFLGRLAKHDAFGDFDVDTGFIDARLDELADSQDATFALALYAKLAAVGAGKQIEGLAHGWALAGTELAQSFHVVVDGEEVSFRVVWMSDHFVLDGHIVSDIQVGDGSFSLAVGGQKVAGRFAQTAGRLFVSTKAGHVEVAARDMLARASSAAAGDGQFHAPMPGKIVSVAVKTGAPVATGDTLLVLEAMKMEHAIKADLDGTVEAIEVEEGEQVEEGALLLAVSPPADA